MAYLDSGSSHRAATRDNGPGAHAGYTAEQKGWAPIPALGSCAFRLQAPLTTEPQGWAFRPTPYPRRLRRTRPLPTDAEIGPVTPNSTVITGQNAMRRTVSTSVREAPLRQVPLSMILDMEVRVVPPRSTPEAFQAPSTSQPLTEGGDSGGGACVGANQERPVTPPSSGGPISMGAIRDVLQHGHEDPDQVALASDTDDRGGGLSDESFEYDYSDGGPVSESNEAFGYDHSDGGPVSKPEEEGLGEALMHTTVPTVRRPYTNVVCGRARGSLRLGRYDHTRRPYAGPDMLAAQIEERRAELAFLRTVWPQVPTQPAGVAPESGARTDDEALGGVESQGVAQGPMVDTDTAGTVECEV